MTCKEREKLENTLHGWDWYADCRCLSKPLRALRNTYKKSFNRQFDQLPKEMQVALLVQRYYVHKVKH